MSNQHKKPQGLFRKAASIGLVFCMFTLTSCAIAQDSQITVSQSSPSSSTSDAQESSGVSATSSVLEDPAWPVFLVGTNTIKTSLKAPWSVVQVGSSYVVSLRDSGEIIEVTSDRERRTLATVGDVNTAGEGGLLGLAYQESEGLYAYVSTADSNGVVRFSLEQQPDGIVLGEGVPILTGIAHGTTHNGGRLAFGPDGMLYISTGDTGIESGDLAQDESSTAGKILRVNPDGSVPQDNPYPDNPVWSIGHRNVQGMAWSNDGTMFATEFGAQTWDELNIIEPGANYGWPEVEGIAGVEGYKDPVQQWETAKASPSGLTINDGVLYIANLRGESIRAVPVSNPNVSELITLDLGRVRDVLAIGSNNLVALTNNTDGRGTPRKNDDLLVELNLGTPN